MLDLAAIPLALYVHLPWCVRKCPYCDFNSHQAPARMPEAAYIAALLADLDRDRDHAGDRAGDRAIESIFIGGGTPSLLSPEAIAALLEGVRARLRCADDLEITLEANPGTMEQGKFRAFRQAGINRLSIGAQSFQAEFLRRLGRIHDGAEALRAVEVAHGAGFENFNVDLMFGLPGQTIEQAEADVVQAIALRPSHVSYYQLTLEPDTPFAKNPPVLPIDDDIVAMQDRGLDLLAKHGYERYEVSAYARAGHRCRHNLNYWTFGDYLGIGAGAHGKLTMAAGIQRTAKVRNPGAYQEHAGGEGAVTDRRMIPAADLPFEFMLNALRLREGVPVDMFGVRTGLGAGALEPALTLARERGLLSDTENRIQATELGFRFLNETLLLFMPDPASVTAQRATMGSGAQTQTPVPHHQPQFTAQ